MFFVVATAAKLSQLHTLSLHARDFWVFEDMIRQLARGEPFLTRFAPHAPGWVQHGAIHAFWVLYLAVPLSFAVGPTLAALLFSPLAFAAAGGALGVLTRKRLGTTASLALVFGFLFSSYVAKTVMYDTHPESAYPLFVFLWMLGCGFDAEGQRPRAMLAAFGLLGGMLIRIDGILIFFPLAFACFFLTNSPAKRRILIATLLVAPLLAAFQFHAIQRFGSGAWGPAEWDGLPVSIPTGDARFLGKRWDSPWVILEVLQARVGQDSLGATVWSFFQIFVSRPFLALVIVAPWVLRRLAFWISVVPAALALNLMGELARKLMLYYSTPLLGAFWAFAGLLARRAPSTVAAWVFATTCLLSPGDLELLKPSQALSEMKAQASTLARCAESLNAPFVVTDPWIGLANRDHVYGDELPRGMIEGTSSVLVSAVLTRRDGAPGSLESRLREKGWREVDFANCARIDGSASAAGFPVLLIPFNPRY
jgi:hypothetical protein